jgi:hypothetical protein
MKEAVFQIKSGKEIVATGSIFDADGKTLDKKAINAVTEMAVSLGYPIETAAPATSAPSCAAMPSRVNCGTRPSPPDHSNERARPQ